MADADKLAPPLDTTISFRDPPSAAVLDSPDQIPATHRHDHNNHHDPDLDNDSDSDFEFAFVSCDVDSFPSITADEIFPDGWIWPMYPVFDWTLLLPNPPGLALAPDTKPSRVPLARLLIESQEERSHGSTGSSVLTGSSWWWKLCDLVVRWSHSDGKEKFVFIDADGNKKEGGKPTEKKFMFIGGWQ
ncbi:hypothetical protein IHE45_19G046200 [Dioscorea alata]|uniref:Uncharacterized protein n=1 Tax=Dioscorea alata TaxID=55571 RepID=A0ACB7TY68_DIOAL|nr:hypothetical protein IHE45_19G046200 [Dioscorea alata]